MPPTLHQKLKKEPMALYLISNEGAGARTPQEFERSRRRVRIQNLFWILRGDALRECFSHCEKHDASYKKEPMALYLLGCIGKHNPTIIPLARKQSHRMT